MPSDDRAALALEALAGPLARYRSAVAEAVDEVSGMLRSGGSPAGDRVARIAGELGVLGGARIDAEAFAGLVTEEDTLDPAGIALLESALETLRELARRDASGFALRVEPGGDLGAAVESALAEAGRAFAAARTAAGIRDARPREAGDASAPFPFRRWNPAERALAPPLVLEIDGADLAAATLAGFLDGAVRLVLVVRGPSPPAPLVRLVSPGVLVVQTVDPSGLEAVAASAGPAVAALVPESAAAFVHDPAGGPAIADRLTVERMPAEPPRARLGGQSAFQQAEDLRQLETLAAGRPAVTAAAAGQSAQPADRLAAWLLARTDLSNLEPGNGAAG